MVRNQSVTPQKRFLRRADVERKTGYSIASIYRLAKEGDFPQPVKLGKRASGWVEEEVDAWIERRVAVSREQNGGAEV
ncbi:MAG: AlpA family transcriptional regulator [Rhodanobacter sp.]